MKPTLNQYLHEQQLARQYDLLADAVDMNINGEQQWKSNSWSKPQIEYRRLPLIPGTPCYKAAKARKDNYLRQAREHRQRAEDLADDLLLPWPPRLFKPKAATAKDRKIKQQYKDVDGGWTHTVCDERGALHLTELIKAGNATNYFVNEQGYGQVAASRLSGQIEAYHAARYILIPGLAKWWGAFKGIGLAKWWGAFKGIKD